MRRARTIDTALPRSYDVIVFADVIEHVAQPDQILAWAASKLAVDGRIIALIPNSANWKFRRKMLHGDWSYAETGYFDRDHLRFFDVRTARASSGWSAGLQEIAVEFAGERLPKPLNTWSRGRCDGRHHPTQPLRRHTLIVWQARLEQLILIRPAPIVPVGRSLCRNAFDVTTVELGDPFEYHRLRPVPRTGCAAAAPPCPRRTGGPRHVPGSQRRWRTGHVLRHHGRGRPPPHRHRRSLRTGSALALPIHTSLPMTTSPFVAGCRVMTPLQAHSGAGTDSAHPGRAGGCRRHDRDARGDRAVPADPVSGVALVIVDERPPVASHGPW